MVAAGEAEEAEAHKVKRACQRLRWLALQLCRCVLPPSIGSAASAEPLRDMTKRSIGICGALALVPYLIWLGRECGSGSLPAIRAMASLVALVVLWHAQRGERPAESARAPRASIRQRLKTLAPFLLLAVLGFPYESVLADTEIDPLLQAATAYGAGALVRLSGVAVAVRGRPDPAIVGEAAVIRVISQCAGMTSLLGLLTLNVVAARVLLPSSRQRWLLMGLSLPVGFVANMARVALSARVAMGVSDPEWLSSDSSSWLAIHDLIGYTCFALLEAALLVCSWILGRPRTKEFAKDASSCQPTD